MFGDDISDGLGVVRTVDLQYPDAETSRRAHGVLGDQAITREAVP